MNFSEALNAMKMGSKVSREAWRGTVSYWTIAEYTDEFGTSNQIYEYDPKGDQNFVHTINPEDILAEDWFLVT